MDADGDGEISFNEFTRWFLRPEAAQALDEQRKERDRLRNADSAPQRNGRRAQRRRTMGAMSAMAGKNYSVRGVARSEWLRVLTQG